MLHDNGYETHAIGKWNLGATVKDYTPTFRGFDSFFGYYNAALGDYWYHGGGSGCKPNASEKGHLHNTYITDLSNSSGAQDPEGVLPAPDVVNGTYDQEMFTAEAVRLIKNRAARLAVLQEANTTTTTTGTAGMYIYLAYQNVHSTAQNKASLSGTHPLQSPCNEVDSLYGTTTLDTYKVMGGMITELDYGIGNVTAALNAAMHSGSKEEWVMVMAADNGGPLKHR